MEIKKDIYKALNRLANKNVSGEDYLLDIGIDSLDLLQSVTELEEHFAIELSEEELVRILTVDNLVDTITTKVKEKE
ncbi:acyl carrier protein [Mycoplasma testudineum]|uniref:Acyl carrier protein n=1 Tax=Mycoplasma testudineum TaxID=244584 RepID=A0A4R6IFM3_9MOLU|nr:phosphopantetheine-binding protein [Mycoplasma testudineum]OYD27099.1 acyl carrier protein [Mycoplasma testudineum]TDO21150.1 acyl carrier protein [Mycoplasma testudineum]